MRTPTIPTAEITVTVDGTPHRLVKTAARGADTCKECSLESVCCDDNCPVHLPSICCCQLGSWRFEELPKQDRKND